MRARAQNGFTLVEMLIVVAIVGIIAAIATPVFLRARMSGNETSAIGSVRAVASGQSSYSSACGQGGYATSLVMLGIPCGGGAGFGFISPDLSAAVTLTKSGYSITMAGNGAAGPIDLNGAATNLDFTATAVPITIGATGQRGFNVTSRNTIFVDPAGGNAGITPLQ